MKPHQAGTINNKQFTDEASWWFGNKSPTKTVFCNSQKSSRSISVNYIVQTQHSTLARQQNWMKLWLCVFWDAFLSLNIPYIRSFDQSGASMPRLRPTTANGWCQRQSSSPWLRDPHITQPIRFQIRGLYTFWLGFPRPTFGDKVFTSCIPFALFHRLFFHPGTFYMHKVHVNEEMKNYNASAALRQEEFGVTCIFPQKKVSILSDIVIEFDLEPCRTTWCRPIVFSS